MTERAAYHHGRYVNPEMDLYTVVDLSRVWALGEVYEYELPLVKTEEKAEIEMPYEQAARPLRGTVTYVYPYLNPTTRTGQIRMEFPNPNYALKPDMFVNVKLRVSLGRQLAVPEDAVLDTGTEQYVFVDKGNGYFEPRSVKPGARAEGYYAITEGLRPGERVATAANFILDSESRLKGAFSKMGAPQEVAVTRPAEQLQIEHRIDPSAAKVVDNSVWVRVTDARGSPIHDASVRVRIFMPAMGSMVIRNSNSEVGGRVVEFTGKEYVVRGRGYIQSLEDIRSLAVGTDGKGTPVRVEDVASVQLGPDMRRGVAELNGEGEVTGGIVVVRYGQNVMDVIERVKEKLSQNKASLPEGVEAVMTYDRTGLIRRSIETLKHTLLEELVIVSIVILIFLWHLPSAIIPIITIPVTVILSFIPMYSSGLTSNIMSLGGIAIAIGAMVDAAIVVVEQTHKKLEHWEAAGRPGRRFTAADGLPLSAANSRQGCSS